jgi:hypothetical protein
MAAAAFLGIVDSTHKVSFKPRHGPIENGPCGRDRGWGVALSMLATCDPASR